MIKKRILLLSPHTDDAELGAGGYISKLIEEGHDFLWVVFSSAKESVPEGMPNDTLANEFKDVMKSLNFPDKNFIIFDYKVRRLNEKRQDVLESLVQIKRDFKPNLVIGPSINDYHQDHQVVASEMIRAFKTSASIISYELPWNNIKFNNQMFIRLEKKHIDKKFNMLQHYHSQVKLNRPYFSEDYIRGHAFSRGAQIGVKYAEVFEVLRIIE